MNKNALFPTGLAGRVIDKKTKTFHFPFDPKLRRYLIQLKKVVYTSYRMVNLIHMENSYSESVYELLKQYETWSAQINGRGFRSMLGLTLDRRVRDPLYANCELKY